MKIIRTFLLALCVSGLFTTASCSLFNQLTGQGVENNDDELLLLLGAAYLATRSSGCTGSSGMVICVPSGIAR